MQICRYKRVPVMFLDLFCDVLHTTSTPRVEQMVMDTRGMVVVIVDQS